MATYQSGIAGELAGSIGGMTFSRNAAGAFVRARVVPTNPMTPAQISARASFGSGAAIFGTLGALGIAQWNQYSISKYSPKNSTNDGQFTGFNAFMSLWQTCSTANRLMQTVTLGNTGVDITAGTTFALWVFTSNASTIKTFGNGISDAGTPQNIGMTVQNSSIDNLFRPHFEILVGAGIGQSLTDVEWYNVSGTVGMGFIVYMSSPNNIPGLAFDNREIICLGSTGVITVTTPGTDLLNVETLDIDFTSGISGLGYKNFPLYNQYVLMSVYSIGVHGQMALIGAEEVEFGV